MKAVSSKNATASAAVAGEGEAAGVAAASLSSRGWPRSACSRQGRGAWSADDRLSRAIASDAITNDDAQVPRSTFSRRVATVDPDSRRAIRRSTTGASTSPTTDHVASTPNVARCRHE